MVPLYTNTLGAKAKDHAPINGLPDGQSSWNFVGSLLASIPNKCDPYWVNPSMFWKWLILLYVTWSRDRAKMWPWPIFFKFTRDVDIDPLNWFGRPEIVNINFGPKKAHLTSLVPLLHQFSHFGAQKLKDHAPINGPSGRPIILKLCRVTTGINTEQTRPVLSKSEHVLKMANFALCDLVTW